jgi:hypothetical protein
MKLSNRYLLIFVLTIAFTFSMFQHFTHAEIVPFDSPRWVMQPDTPHLEDYLGQKSLYLKGGAAYLKDVNFTNGIIEFDVANIGKIGMRTVRFSQLLKNLQIRTPQKYCFCQDNHRLRRSANQKAKIRVQ